MNVLPDSELKTEVYVICTYHHKKKDGSVCLIFHYNGEKQVITLSEQDIYPWSMCFQMECWGTRKHDTSVEVNLSMAQVKDGCYIFNITGIV